MGSSLLLLLLLGSAALAQGDVSLQTEQMVAGVSRQVQTLQQSQEKTTAELKALSDTVENLRHVTTLEKNRANVDTLGQCNAGWIKFGSSCYRVVEEKKTWDAAESHCREFDANLVAVETQAENNFLKRLSRKHSNNALWVGATNKDGEGVWVWAGSKKPIEFSDWAPGEPNNNAYEEHCAFLRTWNGKMQWNDIPCTRAVYFVCEISQWCHVPGWTKFGSSCYGVSKEALTWEGAASLCREFDANLVAVETQAENDFLYELARKRSIEAFWLGGTDMFSEGAWVWAGSKKPIEFSDWAPGEPNDKAYEEDCASVKTFMNHGKMQWNDIPCTKDAIYFVCEIRL